MSGSSRIVEVVRSSRLLAILIHLEATGPSTAGAIAELTEVSLRTAYRDIAALQAAGVAARNG